MAESFFERYEKTISKQRRSSPRLRVAPIQKPETDIRSKVASKNDESMFCFDNSDGNETIFSGNGLAEARKRTREGRRQVR